MAKTGNLYEVTIRLKSSNGVEDTPSPAKLRFDHINHDDILSIAAKMRRTTGLPDDESDAVAVGIKLLSEVMLKEKKNPLFDPLREGMREFIANLKARSRLENASS